MRCLSIALWAASWLIACDGAEPPPPKTPAAVTVVSQEPDVAPEPQPATIVDIVERDAAIFGYFDADEFRRGSLYRAITNVVERVPLARDQVKDFFQTCGFNPIEAVIEVSLSSRVREGDPDFENAVLAARTNTSSASNLDCLARLMPKLERAEVDGHPALAFGDTGGYIVGVESYLVVGQAQTVQRALERLESGARARVPEEILYADLRSADMFEAERVVVSVAHTTRGTECSVLARATSSEEAEKIESSAREFRREGLDELERSDLEPGEKRLISELVESITLDRRGVDLAGAFSFGSPERETAIWGTATSVVASRLERQLKLESAQDAKSSVRFIASLLGEYAMNQVPPRFPESGPLIPAQVPAASNYRFVESDWQQGGWKHIQFRSPAPQPYAFGFETTRGGRKVTVRALGDLDGDGQHSRIEAELEIVQNKSVSEPQFIEHNPLE